MPCSILPLLPDHGPAMRQIYAEGIATGNATFETAVPDGENWGREGSVAAALSPLSSGLAYRAVVEVPVDVAGLRADTAWARPYWTL